VAGNFEKAVEAFQKAAAAHASQGMLWQAGKVRGIIMLGWCAGRGGRYQTCRGSLGRAACSAVRQQQKAVMTHT